MQICLDKKPRVAGLSRQRFVLNLFSHLVHFRFPLLDGRLLLISGWINQLPSDLTQIN